MKQPEIHIIDLNFMGRRGIIAAYFIPHAEGGILVETGPASTFQNLVAGLKSHGYDLDAVTDVLLTHIHLDHAGASGWLAQHGCRIYVHENGAPHLVNPEKLLASAGRLYGDQMDRLWGRFIPVPREKITIIHDNEVIKLGNLSIRALDVPGHANHHLAYLIGDTCFSGDIGGLRISPRQYISLPMPPPDLDVEKWRASIKHIQEFSPRQIIPTHFGIYPDAKWQLEAVLAALDEVEAWMEEKMPLNPTLENLRSQYIDFELSRAKKYAIDQSIIEGQQMANPMFMSADGIFRYWNKFRKS